MKTLVVKKGQEVTSLAIMVEMMRIMKIPELIEVKKDDTVEGDFFGKTKSIAKTGFEISFNLKSIE
jgi:hypothetical protein